MSGHTPGPWHLWGRAEPSQVIGCNGGFVAQTVGGNDEANARLISAAPELLEACLLARHICEDGNALQQLIDAAIAKATGEQS